MKSQEVKYEYRLISPEALSAHMAFREFSTRTLFGAIRPKVPASVPLCRATIGHLRTGVRRNVPVEVAVQIEKVLGVPRGSLFSPRASIVHRDRARVEAGSVGIVTALFGLAFVTAVLIGVAWVATQAASMSQYLDTAGQWIGGIF